MRLHDQSRATLIVRLSFTGSPVPGSRFPVHRFTGFRYISLFSIAARSVSVVATDGAQRDSLSRPRLD